MSRDALLVVTIGVGCLVAIVCAHCFAVWALRFAERNQSEPLTPAPPDDLEETSRCAERYAFLRDHGPMCRPPIGIYWMQSGQILMGDSADAVIDDAIQQKRGRK